MSLNNEDDQNPNNFQLSKNGLNITLIDKTKLDYSQMIDAIQITERQIQKMLQFCAEKEPISRAFLEDQLKFMTEEKLKFEAILPLIKSQIENVTKRLTLIKSRKEAYTSDMKVVENEIEQINSKIKIFETKQNEYEKTLEEQRGMKVKFVKDINAQFFKKAQSLLGPKFELMWQIQEILIGILYLKEKATNTEIINAYSNYDYLINLINKIEIEKLDKTVEENVNQIISQIDAKLAPLKSDPTQAQNKEIYEHFIDLVRCLTMISAGIRNTKKGKEQLDNIKQERGKKEAELAKKKLSEEIFTEDIYLEDQLRAYKKIIELVNQHIDKKKLDISEIEVNLKDYHQKYFSNLGNGISASEKEMVYKAGSKV